MGIWAVQDAKARFSEMLETCLAEGPQIVTRRGKEAAVLVPTAEWQRLQAISRPSRKDVLLRDGPKLDLPIPARGRLRRRASIEH